MAEAEQNITNSDRSGKLLMIFCHDSKGLVSWLPGVDIILPIKVQEFNTPGSVRVSDLMIGRPSGCVSQPISFVE